MSNPNPLPSLSPQLWRLIGAQLTKPVDRQHLCEAYPFLCPVLQESAPLDVLLPKVIPLLGDTIRKRRTYKNLSDVLYVSTRDLVNKACDLAVRDYFQRPLYQTLPFIDERNTTGNLFLGYAHELEDKWPRPPLQWPARLSYSQPTKQLEWLAEAKLTHTPKSDEANQILSRELFLTWDWLRNPANLSPTLELLQSYGQHITRLSISLNISGKPGGCPLQIIHSDLCQWLRELPNLVQIQLNMNPGNRSLWKKTMSSQELSDAITYLDAHPLPELPHLQHLSMRWLAYPVQNAVLHRYRHVRKLEIEMDRRVAEGYRFVALDNLQELTLLGLRSRRTLSALRQLLTSSCPQLHTLRTSFKLFSAFRRMVDFQRAIQFLNDVFGGSTTLLNLYLSAEWEESHSYRNNYSESDDEPDPDPEPISHKQSRVSRLNLPHLQQLRLRLNELFSPDFLLPLAPSLKRLAIELNTEDWEGDIPQNTRIEPEGLIRWNGCLGRNLLQSNLWAEFPQLKFLRVEGFRSGWTYVRRRGIPLLVKRDGRELTWAALAEGGDEDDDDDDITPAIPCYQSMYIPGRIDAPSSNSTKAESSATSNPALIIPPPAQNMSLDLNASSNPDTLPKQPVEESQGCFIF